MVETCPVCGLPKDLCACKNIAREKEKIVVKAERKKWKKYATIIKGIDSDKEELEKIAKDLKKKLACGGTVKEGEIELQGNHKSRVKELLVDMGYSENQIKVR